jgi:hypothetical protein
VQIRKEQLGALAQAQLSRFSARMLVHIREFFPGVCASFGEEKLLLLVRNGIERGKHYGITSERDVCKLIDLMLILGQDMDHKFPRIAATLLLPLAMPPSSPTTSGRRVAFTHLSVLDTVEKALLRSPAFPCARPILRRDNELRSPSRSGVGTAAAPRGGVGGDGGCRGVAGGRVRA